MKPGEDPLASLAECTASQWDPRLSPAEKTDLIARAKEQLSRKESVDALSSVIAAMGFGDAANTGRCRQLLVIDQFEQLFTLVKDEDVRQRFVQTVLHASQKSGSSLHVIATLRIDFFGKCSEPPELWQLMQDHYLVQRMPRERLRETIEKPMQLAGMSPAAGLVYAMLEEVGEYKGGLALLEHALDRLWAQAKGQPPTIDTYNSIGRLRGAIEKHANEVLDEKLKTGHQRETARRIFIALTTLGEGTEDSARRVPKRKLLKTAGQDAEKVLAVLADERLVTVGHEGGKQEAQVWIAHEALIREWKRLQTWLNEGRSDIRLERELEEACTLWLQDPDQVLRGGRLELALQ